MRVGLGSAAFMVEAPLRYSRSSCIQKIRGSITLVGVHRNAATVGEDEIQIQIHLSSIFCNVPSAPCTRLTFSFRRQKHSTWASIRRKHAHEKHEYLAREGRRVIHLHVVPFGYCRPNSCC